MIKNYMEILVDEIFKETKISNKVCKNESCEHDIKVTALNNLPPVYFKYDVIAGEKKAFLLDRQRRISVLAKIIEATDIICSYCAKSEE